MNGSTVQKRWLTVNFTLTTQFSANLETCTPWKRIIQIIKKYLAADWRLEKHYLEWSFPNHRLQERKTTNFCLIYGIMRKCEHLKTFYSGTTTKTLSQHSKQCKKCLFFYCRKGMEMLKVGCTLPNFAKIFLHISTGAKFYPSTETDKNLLEKIREDMLGGPSIVFTRRAVVDETFIRKYLYIYFWHWRKPSLSLFYVSVHANRTIHAMGIRHRI